MKIEDVLDLKDFNFLDDLFGSCDEKINLIKKKFNVEVVVRQNFLKILGFEKDVVVAKKVILYILDSLKKGETITKQNVEFILNCVEKGQFFVLSGSFKKQICKNFKNKPILTQTVSQKKYSELIDENLIVFGVGPAGTGKTYIAVAKAVAFLKEKIVEKIVLTRPVVEAGERLGFLPGDLQNKIDPYLRPLYDVIEEILGVEGLNRLIERKKIEIVPLAYMRGRTLSNSFIILDEAQNTTVKQMKMFLTRFGYGSKMIITGDVTQVDLQVSEKSGLLNAINILKEIDLIKIFNFEKKDIVRHELVQKIVKAYEKT